MDKIANFIYKRSKLIIILVALLNIAALVSFTRFNLDTDFTSAFSKGNPKAEQYEALNAKYQSGEPIQLFIESDSSLLTKENLLAVLRLQQNIATIDGVDQIQSIVPPIIQVSGRSIPLTADMINANYSQITDFIENKYFLSSQLLSQDQKSGVIIISLEDDSFGKNVLPALRELAENNDRLDIAIAGNEVIKDTLWNYLLRIIFILPPVIIILVQSVFFLMLRNLKLSVLSMMPAGVGALWTFGAIFWSGEGLSLVTVLTPLFIIIIGSAYGLHYTSHLLDNLRKYKNDKQKLTTETLKRVGTPIVLSAITTMAGFASLAWTDVISMRQMGIYVSLGVGFAGLLSITLLPAVLNRIKLPEAPPPASEHRITRFVIEAGKRRGLVIAAFAALTVVSLAYIPQLHVESDQLMYFKENSEIRQTFEKLEESFGGALPLTGEISAANPQNALMDANFAEAVLASERELENVPGISSATSVFDVIKALNKIATGEDIYPQNPALIQGMLTQLGDNKTNWVSADGFRVVIKTMDFQNENVADLNAFVQENEHFNIITGLPVLFDEMNDLIVKSQVQSLGLALVVIFIMLWLTLRRVTAALVGLVPIVITIASVLGMLSITGFHLNIMTATLSAIAVGVGIDYSIHIISSIYFYREQGANHKESVRLALGTVARPVLTNALGLIAGYSALFFSPLRIHTHTAAVMWTAMLVASTAALLLVPVFYSRERKQKKAQERAG